MKVIIITLINIELLIIRGHLNWSQVGTPKEKKIVKAKKKERENR